MLQHSEGRGLCYFPTDDDFLFNGLQAVYDFVARSGDGGSRRPMIFRQISPRSPPMVHAMEHPKWFVDFEASGIAPDSYPIEIAIVSVESIYHSLIRPVRYWDHWSWDAQDMHGIPREALLANGTEPKVIADELNARFAGAILCSDSPQDRFWLETLCEAAGIEPLFEVLPLESFVGRSGADEIYRLLPDRHAHRALPDAQALMAATLEYLSRVESVLPSPR